VRIEHVLLLAPAVLLFAGLVLGRYPGEDAIEAVRRLRAAPARRWPRPRRGAASPRRRAPLGVLGPGRLPGTALWARPPPACG
jgi:hypothetical protein